MADLDEQWHEALGVLTELALELELLEHERHDRRLGGGLSGVPRRLRLVTIASLR